MWYYNFGGLYTPPPYVDNTANSAMDYWTRSLLQRLTALIDFKNLPTAEQGQYAWDKDALKFGLFMRGFIVVFKSKTWGLVPQPGTVTGYSLQYQPAGAMVATPYFQFDRPLKIGVECELLKLTPDYYGTYDIITKYAAELKEIDTSIKAAAKNSRLAYALVAADDKSARTLQNIREKILNGDDVIIDKQLIKRDKMEPDILPWHQFDRDIKNSYILGDLLEARRTTLVDFYREIGVRIVEDKKERMINAEVDAGNAETFIRSEVWIESLKESCKKINAHYGTNIIPVLNEPDTPDAPDAQEERGIIDNVR